MYTSIHVCVRNVPMIFHTYLFNHLILGVPSKNGEITQVQAMSMMDQYSDILYTMVNNFGSTTNNGKKYAEDAS